MCYYVQVGIRQGSDESENCPEWARVRGQERLGVPWTGNRTSEPFDQEKPRRIRQKGAA